MAATITELATFSASAFYDNRTWLNQENWQLYFGGALPSGVIVDGGLTADGEYYSNALALQYINSSYRAIRAGNTIINGIFGKYDANTYIPALTSSQVDRLIVARVYQLSGVVKIVGKTKIASDQGYTPTVFAKMLLQDDSVGCVRDESFYEIPLLYEIYGQYSYDLRRLYYLPAKITPNLKINYSYTSAVNTSAGAGVLFGKGFVQVLGGMNYDVQIASADTNTYLYIYPAPSCSSKATTVYIKNNSAVNVNIRLPLSFKGLTYSYEWIDNWDDGSTYKYKELVAGDKIALTLTPFSSDTSFGYTVSSKGMSSGVDPDDYYTKQEMTVLLAAKASTTYVDEGLALKANTADLGSLADQDSVDYATEVTNKPTLGALAAKDKASLTADVTGKLPIANGGTNLDASPSMLTNLASETAADILTASPRPGITGILPIAHGGTGADDLASLMDNIIGVGKFYYVNISSGSDDNVGDNSHPFKTIQHAVDIASYLVKTKVYVAAGGYPENITVPAGKNVDIESSGTVTISGYVKVEGGMLTLNGWGGNLTVSANNQYGAVQVIRNGELIMSNSSTSYVALQNAYSPSGTESSVRGYGLYVSTNSRAVLAHKSGRKSFTIAAYHGIFAGHGAIVSYPTTYCTLTVSGNQTYTANAIINGTYGSSTNYDIL